MKAIIFDLDGTLIDTEKYYRIFWPKAFEHFGYVVTDEQVLKLRSLGRPFSPEYIKKITNDPELDYAKLRNYRMKIMADFFSEHPIELKKGAMEVLGELQRRGIMTALATASDMERATKYTQSLGLYPFLDIITSAVMVKEGKPSPDIYEFAFSKVAEEYALKHPGEVPLKKEDVFAVEDSPNGAQSAYDAGLRVIYIPDQTPAGDDVKDIVYTVKENLFGILELANESGNN